MSCVKKTIYYAHRRLCASNIMRSTSQLPIPGPPRREREGSTRFCRDFKLALSDGSAIENVRLCPSSRKTRNSKLEVEVLSVSR